VEEECPRKARIELDNSLIITSEGLDHLRLSPRCIECAAEYSVCRILKDRGMLIEDDVEQTNCVFEGCTRKRLYRSTHCASHVLEIIILHPVLSIPSRDKSNTSRIVNKQNTSMVKWELDKYSNFQVFLNRKATGARIFAIDLEGDLSSKDLRQAAAIEVDTERVVFNLTISDPVGRSLARAVHKDFDPTLFQHMVKVLGHDFREYSGQPVTRAEAAEIIKSSGIRPSDYILVWHNGYVDLSCLRHNLVTEIGQDEVDKFIPPDRNVIRLNYFFKHNLGKAACCSLELLFGLYFPTHHLRYVHHDSKTDSLKLIQMAKLGEEFYQGEFIAKQQGKLFDWALQSGTTVVEPYPRPPSRRN
jgi:hypothetical protein